MKGWRFFRRRGFLVGVLVAGLISMFGIGKNVNAIGTQTNISTRSTQSASGSSSDCYTTNTGGYTWSSPCKSGSSRSVDAKTGSSYNMTFSHNFRTDSAGVSVDCKVTISKPSGDGTKYKLSDAGSSRYSYGLTSGSTSCDATTGSGGTVSDSNRPYTDGGGYYYIHRDFFEVEFLQAGTYKFCETINASANGYSTSTKGCITYNITDDNFTVTVKAYDRTAGKLLSGYSNSETASSGELCASDVKDWGSISGYTFKGYTTSQTSTTYKTDRCSSSTTTYYAIYEKEEQRTLTAKAINVADGKLNTPAANPMATKTVTKGASATVKRINYTDWTFLCWKKNQTAGTDDCMSSTASYTVDSLTSDTTIYAVYQKNPVNYTLTAYAVDESGGYNTPAGSNPMAKTTVAENFSATVSKVDYDNWVFKCWKTSKTGSCVSENSSYMVDKMTGNVTVYAMYGNGPSFEGKSSVNDTTTGFRSKSIAKYLEIENCSFENGCEINFEHYLKKTGGEGTTSYEIKQASSYASKITTITISGSMSNSSSGGNGDSPIYTSKIKIYPGMIVCQRLTFNSDGASNSVILQVCAFATGTTNSSLDMVVKNKTLGTEYGKEVYAKPGDEIIYKTTYNPTAQYAYFVPMNIINVNGTKEYDGGETLASVSSLRNISSAVGIGDWNNAFLIFGENFLNSFGTSYNYTNGSVTKEEKENEYTINSLEVGRDLRGIAKTNANEDLKTIPKQVKFTANNNTGRIMLDIDTSSIESSASVKVPYNFDMSVEIEKGNGVIYAGEDGGIEYEVKVDKRKNNTLAGEYATIVRDGKLRMVVYKEEEGRTPKSGVSSWGSSDSNICGYYISSNCETAYAIDDQTWNGQGLMDGWSQKFTGSSIKVPDVSAGEKICMAVAVYPSSSGNDLNMSSSGSGSWYISNPKCFSVAKKPSIQIWGGNVFSNGKIDVPISEKKYLAGYNDTGDGNYVFGSWTELGLIANGEVKGLASGAGMGYATNNNGILSPYYYFDSEPGNLIDGNKGIPAPGGGTSQSFCDMSTLSFANDECGSGVGGLRDVMVSTDRSGILEKLRESIAEENILMRSDINEMKLDHEETKLIYSNNDINISGDITYRDDDYTSLDDIPKLFIYAKNININCGVTRIDAVLIAEESIDTCPTDFSNTDPDGGINSPDNSNQLIINGTIITNKLLANRTYGAATGANSIIPAEIINYDSTLYLWGQNNAESLDSGQLEVTYQTELAPRY